MQVQVEHRPKSPIVSVKQCLLHIADVECLTIRNHNGIYSYLNVEMVTRWGTNQRRVYLVGRIDHLKLTKPLQLLPRSIFFLFREFHLRFLSFSSSERLLSCDPMGCSIF